MTQSLIVFAALQLASLAIILAFTALERLHSGAERLGSKRPAKIGTRLTQGPRRKQRRGRLSSRGLTSLRTPAAAAGGLAASNTGHTRGFDISRGLNADRDGYRAKPCALPAT